MTYVYVTWLADALRAEGCRVSEQSGWRNRGRPASTGQFNPRGVLWHHTGTKSSSSNPHPTLTMCMSGRDDLPGPLCQALIGYDGIAYVIAAGRANHAGDAKASGPMPAGDGNALYVGFEMDYDGTQEMSDAQYECSIRAAAAVCRRFGRDASYARGHKETSYTGKWDPGGYDMSVMRGDLQNQLRAGNQPAPEHREIDMIYCVASDGRGFLIGPGYKTFINSPHTRDALLRAGVPDGGVWSSDILNEFPTRETEVGAIFDQLDRIEAQSG